MDIAGQMEKKCTVTLSAFLQESSGPRTDEFKADPLHAYGETSPSGRDINEERQAAGKERKKKKRDRHVRRKAGVSITKDTTSRRFLVERSLIAARRPSLYVPLHLRSSIPAVLAQSAGRKFRSRRTPTSVRILFYTSLILDFYLANLLTYGQ